MGQLRTPAIDDPRVFAIEGILSTLLNVVGSVKAIHKYTSDCAPGKWIHGPAKSLYGHLPEYRDLYTAHANFHLLAGEILKENNHGNHNAVLVLLRGGFTELSNRG